MVSEKPVEAEETEFQDELPVGTKLMSGQYTISKFLNSGGFGITYMAKDSLDRDVVIKECFPDSICRRSTELVRPRSRAHQAPFRSVVELFVKEAKHQAKLEHPNIAGVHHVFMDNDTAYMAIDFIDGKDLLDTIQDKSSVTPENVEHWLRKSLDAIGFIHKNNMLHRDISPDNILINKKNEPVLIDFGAAKETASEANKVLSVLRVVKDGYSPQEFYIQGSKQSPASDLYALGATFYHVITGAVPVDSQSRLASIAQDGKDEYVPLHESVDNFPSNLLKSIDKALSVLPKDRCQSAQEWLDILDGKTNGADETSSVTVEIDDTSHTDAETTNLENEKVAKPANSKKMLFIGAAAVAALASFGVYNFAIKSPAINEDPEIAQTDQTATDDSTLSNDTTVAETDTASIPKPVEISETPETNSGITVVTPSSGSIASTNWTVVLPFETSPSQQAQGTFAKVLLVRSNLEQDVQDWLKSGTTIYSVNGSLVVDNASIISALADGKDLSSGELAQAKLRVQSNPDAEIEEKTMSFDVGYMMELENGVQFTAIKGSSGSWATTVTNLPDDREFDLRVGDIIMSEAQTGMSAKNSDDVEKIIKSLDEKGNDTAYLTVARSNALKAIQLSLN